MTSRKAGFDKSNPYRSAPKVRYVHCIGISFLDADGHRLFPNSGFRHSELGRKILNIYFSADICENLRPNLIV